MKKYSFVEHTADVFVEGYGSTLKEAIENTALGLFAFTADLKKVKENKNVIIKQSAASISELVSFVLNELVSESDAGELFFKKFVVNKLDLTKLVLEGVAYGSKMTPEAGEEHVKAVTHHGALVFKGDNGWVVRVLLDI
ncbi:MAG: archease [Candidatus Micrarchaeota archaeon]